MATISKHQGPNQAHRSRRSQGGRAGSRGRPSGWGGLVLAGEARRAGPHASTTSAALVWIDSREAVIVRVRDRLATIERLESEVPAHHRATGHVRHDPMVRHGGGRDQSADEPHRQEHLARFVDAVTDQLRGVDELLLLGPGTVREHLQRRLRETPRAVSGPPLRIVTQPSGRETDRQLVARLRRHLGVGPRRRKNGACRWTGVLAHVLAGPSRRCPTARSRTRSRQIQAGVSGTARPRGR